MDVKEAIAAAKAYLFDVYHDEEISQVGVEELEHDDRAMIWTVGLSFSRPWTTPRTRAQEVLETLGGTAGQRRSVKVFKFSDEGDLISMRNMERLDAAG